MKRAEKIFLSMFLAVIMAIIFVPVQTWASETSGKCGADVTWKLSEGVLTISGSGAMSDYQYPVYIDYGVYEADTPWYDSREGIKEIIVEEGVTSIGNNAFLHCSEVTSIILPETLTSIRESAFYNCMNLTEITIPETVMSIGNYAFNGCSSLTEISIPESVTSIGTDAFRSCHSLRSIMLPKNITTVEDNTFAYCTSLKNVILSENVTSIGRSAFNCCRNLASVTLPEGVTSIGGSAFSDCDNLKNVILPDKLTKIGYNAFSGCENLESVEIPQTVMEIGGYAFHNCPKLTDIYYQSSEETWKGIEIGKDNEGRTNANVHYNVQSMSFADVSEPDWFYNSVKYVYTEGIMKGVAASRFKPDTATTRAMIVTMLYRLRGEPEVKLTEKFADVPGSAWYAKAVAWAVGEGITKGTGDGTTFSPDEEISRQQMVTMLCRYAGVENYTAAVDLKEAYPDGDAVSSWAWEAFGWAVDQGLINGKTGNEGVILSPKDGTMRSEAATIFMRFCKEV